MVSAWLNNNKVHLSIVNVEERNYLVYINVVARSYPKLVEDLETGRRVSYSEVSHELQGFQSHEVDQMVKHMISKL